MRTILFSTICIILVSGIFAADDLVVSLDDSNFQTVIDSQDLTLVEFFAPWCGHCKALAPEYSAAAEKLKDFKKGGLAKVDCTEDQELCNKHNIRGFPTLKLFRKGSSTPSDYQGPRKADAIAKFLIKQATPAVTELASSSEVSSFSKGETIVVIAFTSNDEQVTAFSQAAEKLRNEFSFGIVKSSPSINEEFHVTEPSILIYRDFDYSNPKVLTGFSGADFEDNLVKFIRVNSFPVVGTIGPENYQKYVERGFNFVWIFVNPSDDSQTALINDVITPVAKDHSDKLSFVQLDGVKWAEHAKTFGLTGTTPSIAIEDRKAHKNYAFNEQETPTLESFRTYIESYVAGTLAATVKSEPVPTSNDGPVKVIVGHTFEQIVMDPTKNVFVEFYAPWCGHCKQLAPKFDELGLRFKDDPDVVIAKIDATANDSPADIQGFPTLLLYPAGAANKASPVDFGGDRSVDAMAEFISKNKIAVSASSENASTHTHAHEEL